MICLLNEYMNTFNCILTDTSDWKRIASNAMLRAPRETSVKAFFNSYNTLMNNSVIIYLYVIPKWCFFLPWKYKWKWMTTGDIKLQ